MKEIKDDLNKRKDIEYLLNGEFKIVKMPILCKIVYRFSTICIKILMMSTAEME